MKLTIQTPADFSFYETVHAHGWRDLAPFQWDETTRTLTRSEHLTDGKVIRLSMREGANDGLEIETDADSDEEEITKKVRRIFQLDVDITRFHTFCGSRAELAPIPQKKQGRILRSPTLWEDAVKVILTTNTTWAQTKAMTRRFVAEWGAAHVSNPEIRAFPLPQRIAALDFDRFAALAKVGYRAAAIYELATDIAAGRDFEAWNDCSLMTEELRKSLLKLRGVGPYAAACLLLYLGRPDRVNSDSWARTLVGRELGRAVSDADVHAFFADYGEWRGLIYHFYAWRENEENAAAFNAEI